MGDGIGLAEALLGMDGFRVLGVDEVPDELIVTIETTRDFVGCGRCGVRAEAQDRMRIEIRDLVLAHHDTSASNGPTEGLNLLVKKVKRCGHGFQRFEHYRLRVLLHTGGITWPSRPTPSRIRTRAPHSNA